MACPSARRLPPCHPLNAALCCLTPPAAAVALATLFPRALAPLRASGEGLAAILMQARCGLGTAAVGAHIAKGAPSYLPLLVSPTCLCSFLPPRCRSSSLHLWAPAAASPQSCAPRPRSSCGLRSLSRVSRAAAPFLIYCPAFCTGPDPMTDASHSCMYPPSAVVLASTSFVLTAPARLQRTWRLC